MSATSTKDISRRKATAKTAVGNQWTIVDEKQVIEDLRRSDDIADQKLADYFEAFHRLHESIVAGRDEDYDTLLKEFQSAAADASKALDDKTLEKLNALSQQQSNEISQQFGQAISQLPTVSSTK